jgi:MFS family permease
MEATVAVPEQARGKSFREVWLITLGHALTHWYPATFYLLLPIIAKELGLSYGQIGLIMTCQYVAGAIANVPGGILVDTVGRKGVLMALSLFWVGFPYLLMGFSRGYPMLLGCVALVGFGNSLWHPSAMPTLARRFPERKGLVLSLHGMGGNVGDAVAPIVVGALLTVLTWREGVVLNVVPGLLMSVLLLVSLRTLSFDASSKDGEKASRGGRVQSFGEYFRGVPALFRNRSLILLTTSSAFRSMTQNALLTFLPVYLAYEMGYSPFGVGAGMFALQAAGFAASPVAGHLSDRMGRRTIMVTSMLMSAVVLGFMAVAGRSHAFIGFVAILGFFLYAIRPVMQAWLLETTPKNMGGTSIGILFAAQALGSSVAPLAGGLIADRHGLTATFWFLAFTIVVANLFILAMPNVQQNHTAARNPISFVPLLRGARRWLASTSNRTFIVWPVLLAGIEALLHRGPPPVHLWALPMLAWGYLQYWSVGRYRSREGGGGPGISVPPQRLVTAGPYRWVRNPMYLGHLIFLAGLALALGSWAGAAVFAFHVVWFHRRVREDEARLDALFGEPYREYRARVRRWIPGVL